MGIEVSMQGIDIGPISLRFYAIALVSGLIAGAFVARAEARRRRMEPDRVWDIALLGFILGVLGARLYHVLDARNIEFYLDNPHLILAIWRGGLGIFGALVGAVAAVLIYCRITNQPPLRWLDVGAPGILVGQAIGRWGNFFNQEVFGRPTDLPWGIPIPQENVAREAPEYLGETHFHPLFLYESLLCALGAVVLLYVARRYGNRLLPGDMILLYFIWYPAVRFSLEFLRAERWEAGGMPMAQIVSLALIVGAVALLVWRHRMRGRVEASGPGEAARGSGRDRAARRRSARARRG